MSEPSRNQGGKRVETQRRAAIETIRHQAKVVERREVAKAVAELKQCGELTDQERKVIQELAAHLVAELLDPVETALEKPADPETIETALELFGGEDLRDDTHLSRSRR